MEPPGFLCLLHWQADSLSLAQPGKVEVKVAQSCLTLCNPMDYIVHGILQARVLEWVAFPFSRGSPNPGIKPGSPTLQADSLPAEPQGKPKNTEVGSLSFLQQIFPAQESYWGLLHCRWILYQLSYQGSPWEAPVNVLLHASGTSLVAQMVNNLPAMQETQVWSLGQEDPLEKGMATHSIILTWRIPRTAMWRQRVGQTGD